MIGRALSYHEDSILKTDQLLTKMIRNRKLVARAAELTKNKKCSADCEADENTQSSTTTENDSHTPSISWLLTKRQSKRNMIVSVADGDDDDNASVISALSEPGGHVVGLPACSSFLQDREQGFPVFQQSLIVDRTWKQLQLQAGYDKETLGKRIAVRLTLLGAEDGDVTRFQEVCRFLVDTVDVMVSLMSPDIDEFQDELQELGQECKSQGIPIHLLGSAVGEAVKMGLQQHPPTKQEQEKEDEEDIQACWKAVIDFVASKMMAGNDERDNTCPQ